MTGTSGSDAEPDRADTTAEAASPAAPAPLSNLHEEEEEPMEDTPIQPAEEEVLPSSYAGVPLSLTSFLPSADIQDTPSLNKYWSQRFRLFSKYSQGIQLDHGECMSHACQCMSHTCNMYVTCMSHACHMALR